MSKPNLTRESMKILGSKEMDGEAKLTALRALFVACGLVEAKPSLLEQLQAVQAERDALAAQLSQRPTPAASTPDEVAQRRKEAARKAAETRRQRQAQAAAG